MINKAIILFTGGTGGHVIPAVNFGNHLIKNGYKCLIFLDKRGLRYADNFYGKKIIIESGHLSGNFFSFFKSILLLIIGFIKSLYYLSYYRPAHCVAFGSYASFMPLMVATLLRALKITSIHLHEQNSMLGKVNLFFIPFAKNVFLNFKYVKNLKKNNKNIAYHVGLPCVLKNQYNNRLTKSLKNKKLQIFLYGGSQGSKNLNNFLIKLLNKLPQNYIKKMKIIIQSPTIQKKYIANKLKKIGIENEINDFFIDIHKILNSSDIVISRSGAGTINDIILSQVPSILVPISKSIYNHQYHNAKFLFDKNAAELIEEKEFDLDTSYQKCKELIDNIDQRVIFINNLKLIKVLDTNSLMLKKILQ